VEANATPFAGKKVDTDSTCLVFLESVEPAIRKAQPAARALLPIDSGLLAALENVPLLDLWMEEQMEVGGVHVDVGQDGVLG
jgi:hypothetical protein